MLRKKKDMSRIIFFYPNKISEKVANKKEIPLYILSFKKCPK